MRFAAVVLLALLAAPLAAQQASYTYIHQSAPCNSGRPWLVALGVPTVGGVLQLQVPVSTWNFPNFTSYVLVTGARNPTTPLGAILPSARGVLLASPDVIVSAPGGSPGGTAVIDLPIPGNPSLLGSQFFQQVVESCGGPWCNSICAGRGGRAVVGAVAARASYRYIDQPPPHQNPNPPWLVAWSTPVMGTNLDVTVPPSGPGLVPGSYQYYFLLTGLSNPTTELPAGSA